MAYDAVILGSGPAGYSAAIYLSRAGHRPLLLTGMEFGGAIARTMHLENYPGFPQKIDGVFLTEEMRKQAEVFGTEIMAATVASVDFGKRPLVLRLDDGRELETESVIVATGSEHRALGLPNEKALVGNGVSYCATCDGFFFKGKDVFIVGGGNAAAHEALHLSTICKSVTLVHRKPVLSAETILQERLRETGNIKIILESTIDELVSKNGALSAVRVKGADGKIAEYHTPALFISIGSVPRTEIFKGQLELDAAGYIKCLPDLCSTSAKGVFAAGDVRSPRFRQAVIAAGSGAQAAMEANDYLSSL